MAGGYGEEVVGNVVSLGGWEDGSRAIGAINLVLGRATRVLEGLEDIRVENSCLLFVVRMDECFSIYMLLVS